MSVVAERQANGRAVVCPLGRDACERRGTLCASCSADLQAQLRARPAAPDPAPADDGRDGTTPLTDGQAFFILRVKLLGACRAGRPFEAA